MSDPRNEHGHKGIRPAGEPAHGARAVNPAGLTRNVSVVHDAPLPPVERPPEPEMAGGRRVPPAVRKVPPRERRDRGQPDAP